MYFCINRKITKVRNVVERLFARLKQWKILRYEHDIHYDPSKIHIVFKIMCSFHNAFGSPLYKSYEEMDQDADRILQCQNMTNILVDEEGKTASGWKGIKPDQLHTLKETKVVPDFELTDLRRLACGPYALKLAIPYYHHANNVKYMLHSKYPNSVRTVGIVSRHTRNDVSKTQYRVYHRFDPGGDFMKTESYCTCGVGKRTVCLCAHMCASLYVLYHQMNNKDIPSQCKLVDKHKKSMIDLYYWKGAWDAQPTDMNIPALEPLDIGAIENIGSVVGSGVGGIVGDRNNANIPPLRESSNHNRNIPLRSNNNNNNGNSICGKRRRSGGENSVPTKRRRVTT